MGVHPAGIDLRCFDPRFRKAFTNRQRVWSAMRSFTRPFSATDVHRLSGVGLGETARLIFGWCGRGLLSKLSNSTSFSMTDAARERPAPPPLQIKQAASIPHRSGRQRMWSAMRVLRTFDLPTLTMASDTSEANARVFLRALHTARYLGLAGETAGGWPIYRLVRDSGPLHPIVRHRREGALTVIDLDDRNTGSSARIRTVCPPPVASSSGKTGPDGGGES